MITTVAAFVAVALGAIANILHYVAPRTKNTVDDKAAVIVDEIEHVAEQVAKGGAS